MERTSEFEVKKLQTARIFVTGPVLPKLVPEYVRITLNKKLDSRTVYTIVKILIKKDVQLSTSCHCLHIELIKDKITITFLRTA